jgi:O-antigen ligase
MKISKENHSFIINCFLFLIATTIIFRKPCTLIIIVFSLYSLLFIKKMEFPKKAVQAVCIIAIPFLLEVCFFWNNDDFSLGIKSLEKSLSLLLLPIFIIGNYKFIHFYSLLKAYSITTTLVLLFFLVRYYFVYQQFFLSFYYGMNMWQMGYHFAGTIGMHAPALNMHIAFVSICNLYFLITIIKSSKVFLPKLFFLVLFLLSFIFLLIINTRIALFASILAYCLVLSFQFGNSKDLSKMIKSAAVVILATFLIVVVFIKNNQFMEEKYNRMIFDRLNMVGKLDEIERPEVEIYSSLVTRLSIWKSTIDLTKEHLLFGVGSSDSKNELFKYYKQTNQFFLIKHQFPVHNQYLDFLLKFGVFGLVGVLFYIGYIGYIGLKLKNAVVISFFVLFLISNVTDDFLIRFDGIVFSGFWMAVFTAFYFKTSR